MRIVLATLLSLWHLSYPAAAEPLRVLTDIAPVQSLVAMVMGDVGTPDVLLGGSTDPHHIQLRPSQVRAIARADLVFWIGEPLTPWLAEPLQSIAKPGAALSLLTLAGTNLRTYDNVGVDPHAWLDPENAVLWVDAIASTLGKADPDHALAYRANANTARTALGNLTTETHQSLAGVHERHLIAAHDSLGYFADRFNLSIIATVTDGDAEPPGAARIAALRKIIAGENVACIFSEYGQPSDRTRTLTEGFTVPTSMLDLTGAQQSPGPTLYPDLIRALADAIVGCVGQTG